MHKWRASKRAAHRRAGVTLVELLVSLTVLAVMVSLLAALFTTTSQWWAATEARMERARGARLLADLIAPELRAAMLPVEGVVRAGSPNLQFLVNPPTAMVPAELQNPHCVFWQAPLATDKSMGDVAEVGYFVKWEAKGTGAVPSLQRFFVNPTIYQEGSKRWVMNPDFLIYRSAAAWLNPALIARTVPADAASGYAGLFAENVVGLWVRLFGADGAEIPLGSGSSAGFDSRLGYQCHLRASPAPDAPLKTVRRYLPARVQLSIAQVDSRHAAQVEANWERVRDWANAPGTADAAAFQARLEREAGWQATARALLPGMSISEVEVALPNAR